MKIVYNFHELELVSGHLMDEYINILKKNYGFEQPERWVDFARAKSFVPVKYSKVESCPYCASTEFRKIGSYVYYSTFHTLRECAACALCYVDVLIDSEVRKSHFETAYKQDSYFEEERNDIFQYILTILENFKPNIKKILEVGGATGILLAMIRSRFSDVFCVLNDISAEACLVAQKKGLTTIQSEIAEIELKEKQDVILAIDVLYYELDIRKTLQVFSRVLDTDGLLILRLPNKFELIKVLALFNPKKEYSGRLKYFNPEHVLLLTKSFLTKSLHESGFSEITICPSPLLRNRNKPWISRIFYSVAVLIFKITGIIVTPSMFVIAKK